jgi:hypothetical protein
MKHLSELRQPGPTVPKAPHRHASRGVVAIWGVAAALAMTACFSNWEVGEGQVCLPGALANPVCARGLECSSGVCKKKVDQPARAADAGGQDASLDDGAADTSLGDSSPDVMAADASQD